MHHKPAPADYPITLLLARRWSPRAFDRDRPVARADLLAVLEAARWAPSADGREPARFLICDRLSDEAAWSRAHACLLRRNQVWAWNAPVLLLACADHGTAAPTSPGAAAHANPWAGFDCGAACLALALEASARGLAAHAMAGFDDARLRSAFALPAHYRCHALLALGHPADPGVLGRDLYARELAPRRRRPLSELCCEASWERPLQP